MAASPQASAPALTVEAALERIAGDATALPDVETVPLLAAAGRVLAADALARFAQPPFNSSAMDGYAVRAADLSAIPARLRIIGESAAGHGFRGPVGSGEAVRIFTGAPIPEGADAIVIQEDTSREGHTVVVRDGTIDPEFVRPVGGDFTAGATGLRAGRRLTPRDITLAAAMGHACLTVRRKPIVAILATGDELVLPGEIPSLDQIVCSNTFGIAAMVAAAGGEPRLLGIARDSPESLGEHVSLGRDADILVTAGGASVGDHDLVSPVLQARGMTLDFWKIAMRPGKPLMFGRLDRQRVLGLPGNPVSSLICARLFLIPLLRALQGLPRESGHPMTGITAVPLPANGPRTHYMRATSCRDHDGHLRVTPVRSQDSSLLTPLAAADCLIVRPIKAPPLPSGAQVPLLALDF